MRAPDSPPLGDAGGQSRGLSVKRWAELADLQRGTRSLQSIKSLTWLEGSFLKLRKLGSPRVSGFQAMRQQCGREFGGVRGRAGTRRPAAFIREGLPVSSRSFLKALP